jgi:glutathione S-transferase
LIGCRRQWGQWWVYFLSEGGHTLHLPASWTDIGPRDPFVEQSQGRAIARVEDLLDLVKVTAGGVKEITPHV